MTTIWKFTLQVTDVQTVKMPLPAKILTIQPQVSNVCLWAEVDPNGDEVNIDIVVVGTGHPLPEVRSYQELRYVNTFQLHGGSLVFHAYEVVNRAH